MRNRNPLVSAIKDLIYHGFESFGRFYSNYRGFVFDNADPLNAHRVKLIIPEVGGSTPYEYWAIPKGVFSGAGYGSQLIPQKGELVWVEFERGHPEVPIYTLGYRGHDELPEDDADLKDVNCYWFKSPYGHLIKINDTKKSITIKTNGAELTIDQSGKFHIANGDTDLNKLLTHILQTYMKTTTVMGDPLSPTSVNRAVDNLKEVNKLLS